MIELLKHSGKSPVLLVQWRPVPNNLRNGVSPIRSDEDASRRGRGQQNGENSGSDSALESDISPRNESGENQTVNPEPDQNALLAHLKEQVNGLLFLNLFYR